MCSYYFWCSSFLCVGLCFHLELIIPHYWSKTFLCTLSSAPWIFNLSYMPIGNRCFFWPHRCEWQALFLSIQWIFPPGLAWFPCISILSWILEGDSLQVSRVLFLSPLVLYPVNSSPLSPWTLIFVSWTQRILWRPRGLPLLYCSLENPQGNNLGQLKSLSCLFPIFQPSLFFVAWHPMSCFIVIYMCFLAIIGRRVNPVPVTLSWSKAEVPVWVFDSSMLLCGWW